MKVTDFRPMIWTENIKESIDFYTNVLGFNCHGNTEDWGWASLRWQGAAIMLARPNEHEPHDKIGFTGSFYFNVADVDAVWNELKDKAKVCYEIETFDFGMREFAIYDNNGYLLQFGEEVV